MGRGTKGGPYEPEDLGEKIFKAHDEKRTLKTLNEEKTIKNTHLTACELAKLTGKAVNTTRRYVEREDYALELDHYLRRERGWSFQQTEKTEVKPTAKIVGCAPGPLSLITYPILPKWRAWIQDDRPQPLQNLLRFIKNRPRCL